MVMVRLKHCSMIPSSASGPVFTVHPQHLRPMDVRIDRLYYGQKHWHNVHVLLERGGAHHWLLSDVSLEGKHYTLKSTGDWWFNGNKMATDLKGVLRFKYLSQLLAPWPISHVVESRWGQLGFNLHWPQPPYHTTLAKAHGRLSLQLHDGKITHLNHSAEEKIALGKLLSILSLQTLPRRLTLDFSDLSHQGFNFDKFSGDFHLQHGQLTIDQAALESPIAYVQLLGSVNLLQRLYHVQLRITPYVTASLPIVATLAGGPVAGIITWVANKLLTHEMRHIAAYTYRLEGPWQAPHIAQVSLETKK